MRAEPTHYFVGDCKINLPVLLEREPGIDPITVRFVPNAPIPLSYRRTAPLLDAIPHQLATALCEPAYGGRVIKRWAKFGQGDHRRGTGINHGLHIEREGRPISDG